MVWPKNLLRVEQKLRKSPKDSYLRKQFIKLKRIEALVEKERENSNKMYHKNLKPYIFQIMMIFGMF